MKNFLLLILILAAANANASQDSNAIFPLAHYDQTITTWINPADPNVDKALLSPYMQQKHLDLFYAHYIGSLSPWDEAYVKQVLQIAAPDDFKTIEQSLFADFDNTGKAEDQMGYDQNAHPYTSDWLANIVNNINMTQFEHLIYHADNHGIATANLAVRLLPTDDVYFYSQKKVAEGYPFDHLQMSALWVGTPVYLLGETRDHVWVLVLTPDYIGWVKSTGIARTSNDFVVAWIAAAKNKLAAITHTQTPIIDEHNKFLFSAYVGAVFPVQVTKQGLQIQVPVAQVGQQAIVKNVMLASKEAEVMPLSATSNHFSQVMSTLIGRPYGWGGLNFNNDCSAELKSLFTPFGIWLPRHSSYQVTVGKMVDMTAANAGQRVNYLMQNGQPFLTLVYIGGHVILYIGNYPNSQQDSLPMAMTYQNMWGLKPNPAIRVAVIGKAVLFPLLLQYPEDKTLVSLANKSYFQVSYLDQLPVAGLLGGKLQVDITELMRP